MRIISYRSLESLLLKDMVVIFPLAMCFLNRRIMDGKQKT